MSEHFLLDQLLQHDSVYGNAVPKEFNFLKRNRHAKKFLIEPDVGQKLYDLWKQAPELYEEQRRFAKPPFPETYVEYRIPYEVDPSQLGSVGLFWAEGRTITLAEGPSGVLLGRITVDVLDTGLLARDQRPHIAFQESAPKEMLVENAIYQTAITEILWILLHRPGLVKLRDVPDRKVLARDGLKSCKAHNAITIDLAAKDIAKTLTRDGSRGSGVREHHVRGTWVHLKHVRSCAHNWQEVVRKQFEPITFDCPICGTRRVFRADHYRGDASRGNTFNTYEVKDSRLEKPKHPYAPRHSPEDRPQA